MKLKRKWYIITILLVLIPFAIAIAALPQLRYRFGKAVQREGIVLIPHGANFASVMDSLRVDSLLLHPDRFERLARANDYDRQLHSGRYLLKKGMTYRAVVNLLSKGRQEPVRVTFNNIRTLDRLAGVVSRRLEFDSISLLQALRSDSVAALYGYTPNTFMTMFQPNTYELYWDSSVSDFLNRMQRESDKFWAPRTDHLAASGMSRAQVATLASIVYEETKKKDEMPRVAGVYLNRIRIGMPLQADPTVKFALNDFGLRRIFHKHLTVDSPYNTYKNTGLPPGPISMPSIDALDAVLSAETHNYIYFCAREDFSGYHNFAATWAEHQKNARTYARALNQRNIR